MTRATATAYARARIGRTFHIVKPLATLTVHENVTVGALCVIQSRTRAHAPPLSSAELAWAR
jgi:ABC-type branched-subunit amino acid transport system ATPase component